MNTEFILVLAIVLVLLDILRAPRSAEPVSLRVASLHKR